SAFSSLLSTRPDGPTSFATTSVSSPSPAPISPTVDPSLISSSRNSQTASFPSWRLASLRAAGRWAGACAWATSAAAVTNERINADRLCLAMRVLTMRRTGWLAGLTAYTYYCIVTRIMSVRAVKQITQASPTVEGAGVHLRRAFGFGNTSEFDPFLLLDDFRNDRPADYLAGFPWHPHRGIETITYVLAGTVAHGDSLGNTGALSAGDVQWMTAGRGILHQEMPKGDADGRMHGFQLWANLPASLKMSAPRYQDIKAADIPEVTDDDGTH